jgi:hypothetical protein
MIPTLYKSRLPRSLSHPIGAQALSEALAGAPHVGSFTVAFSDLAIWPKSRFQKVLAEKQPYQILTARFSPGSRPGYGGSNKFIESGWYDAKWELMVYPVLRELRHVAHRLLLEQGLTSIKRWLDASARRGWMERWQYIELVFHPAESSLSAQESSHI